MYPLEGTYTSYLSLEDQPKRLIRQFIFRGLQYNVDAFANRKYSAGAFVNNKYDFTIVKWLLFIFTPNWIIG